MLTTIDKLIAARIISEDDRDGYNIYYVIHPDYVLQDVTGFTLFSIQDVIEPGEKPVTVLIREIDDNPINVAIGETFELGIFKRVEEL